MSTMTGNLRRTMLLGALGALVLAGAATVVRADVASDRPGAILVFPKIVVDPSGVLGFPQGTDTELEVVNTSNSVVAARCYIIDQTSHCSNDPGKACTAALAAQSVPVGEGGCGTVGVCVPPCSPRLVENDFRITLTKRQPISWKASQGLRNLPCSGSSCPGGASNRDSSILAVQEVPFIGEIKCVEVDPSTFAPSNGLNPDNNFIGDLKGEATIVSTGGLLRPVTTLAAIDARKYNAIGLQSTGVNDGNLTLCVGGGFSDSCPLGPEYNGCPKVITLNNLFDGAPVVTHRGQSLAHTVTTDLTVVPCSEDLFTQVPTDATLQFLIFNEFEQRFSTSTGLRCFKEVTLADIDSRPGPFGDAQSIFSFSVQGTLAGQTRIRPVSGATSDRRVLALTEEFWTQGTTTKTRHSAAANTFFIPSATEDLGDKISIPND